MYWFFFFSWCSYAPHHCSIQVPLVLDLPSPLFCLFSIFMLFSFKSHILPDTMLLQTSYTVLIPFGEAMSQCSRQGCSLLFSCSRKNTAPTDAGWFKSKNVEVPGQNSSTNPACWCLFKCGVKQAAARCPRVTWEEPCIMLIDPVSFGSCLLLECDCTFSVNIVLLIANVEMGILPVKLSTFNA